MIGIAVHGFGKSSGHFHLDRAIGPDFKFLFEHNFRLLTTSAPPEWARAETSPGFPARVPWTLDVEPAVAAAVEPVPSAEWKPEVIVAGAHHFDFYGGFRNGCSMVVVRFDRRLE